MKISLLAHKIRKKIRFYDLEKESFLLLVSGGKDSMALLSAFSEITDIRFRVLSIHHGEDENKEYRDQSLSLVSQYCDDKNIEFITNKEKPVGLSSEEDFRDYRSKVISSFKKEAEVLVSAHHAEDLLETRLIRLIRGTGPEGLVAMKDYEPPYFRPFLSESPEDLKSHLDKKDLAYLEDPTNQNSAYFRNWLRKQWLPQIEEKGFGSKHSLAMSLDAIANAWLDRKKEYRRWFNGSVLDRKFLLNLDFSHQLQVLSLFLQENNIYEFRRSQLEEALKLLDKRQKDYTFNLIDIQWIVSQYEIRIEKLA